MWFGILGGGGGRCSRNHLGGERVIPHLHHVVALALLVDVHLVHVVTEAAKGGEEDCHGPLLVKGGRVHLHRGLVSKVCDNGAHPLSVGLHGLALCDWRLAGEQVNGLAGEGGVGGAVLRAPGPSLAGLAGVEEGVGGLHLGLGGQA